MDIKIDICRNTEWDPNLFEKMEFDDKQLKEIETYLSQSMNVENHFSLFLMGHFYYDQKDYKKAFHYFEVMANRGDLQSKYMMASMTYDGDGTFLDMPKGFELMKEIALVDPSSVNDQKNVVFAAAFNVGVAYFYGFGIKQSDFNAERFWIIAADKGSAEGNVKSKSMLGLFYSLFEFQNLELSFFYHTCANIGGSLESLGALGIMYLYGLGVKNNEEEGYLKLKEASNKGNVLAMGELVKYYYNRRLYTKAVEWATKAIRETEDVDQASISTECTRDYIKRGLSLANFYYARCLSLGKGIDKDEAEALRYYSDSFYYDKKLCSELYKLLLHGLA